MAERRTITTNPERPPATTNILQRLNYIYLNQGFLPTRKGEVGEVFRIEKAASRGVDAGIVLGDIYGHRLRQLEAQHASEAEAKRQATQTARAVFRSWTSHYEEARSDLAHLSALAEELDDFDVMDRDAEATLNDVTTRDNLGVIKFVRFLDLRRLAELGPRAQPMKFNPLTANYSRDPKTPTVKGHIEDIMENISLREVAPWLDDARLDSFTRSDYFNDRLHESRTFTTEHNIGNVAVRSSIS